MFRLGIACNSLKKPEDALVYFNQILHKEKNNTDVIINKGYSLHLMGQYKQAILCFNKILKNDPEEMNSLYFKAKSTAKQNNNKQTCALITKLLELERKNAHNHEHEHEHGNFLNKIKSDPDFIGLRHDQNFKTLIK